MTEQQTQPSRPGETRGGRVVAALVERGLVGADRTDEAVAVVDAALTSQLAGAIPLRRRLAELAGYVGGALVVAAAALFIADRWLELTLAERLGLLGVVALLLAAAGVVAAMTRGGLAALRAGHDAVRRHLASVLLTAAAATAAATVMVWIIDVVERRGTESEEGPLIGLGGSLTLIVLATGGYLIAPSLVGQFAIALGTAYAVPFLYDSVGDIELVPLGLTYLAVGAIWLVMAERGVWRETLPARLVGAVMVLVGAQVPASSETPWVGYLVTVVLAAVAFTLYVARRAWPYLAVGVLGVTLAVPEALMDWTEGSLGTAGVLLVAGVALLGASLFGLRLHKEAGLTGPGTPVGRHA